MIETVSLAVPSHPKYLYVIRSALYPVVCEAGFPKKEARRVVLAVDEACSNIIKYAYEGDDSQKIALDVSVEPARLLIKITDTGKKTDASKIAPRKLDEIRPGGLGTHFMAEAFDSIEYDTTPDRGTVLTLVKVRRSQ